MTVALIAYYLGPRLGIGQYLDRLLPPLATALLEKGIEFTILSSPNAFENTPSIQQIAKTQTGRVDVLPQLDYPPGKRYFWLATQFNQCCRDRNIDQIVWLSNPVLLPWHPPTIAVIHDVNEWKAKEKYGSRLKTTLRSLIYLDASIKLSQAVVAVSQATAEDLLHFRPQLKRSNKLKVISNGADSSLSSLPRVAIEQSGQPFLLSVGRIDPAAKQLPAALELVKAMRSQSNQPWELQLVGGMNQSTQADGEAFLNEVEPLDWVHYQGHVGDAELAQWYRQAAAVVYLSDSEGFGLPIAEAASFNQWVVVNQNNQAAVEVGQGSIISIDLSSPATSAKQVLDQLGASQPTSTARSLPTWKAAANDYTKTIINSLKRSNR